MFRLGEIGKPAGVPKVNNLQGKSIVKSMKISANQHSVEKIHLDKNLSS